LSEKGFPSSTQRLLSRLSRRKNKSDAEALAHQYGKAIIFDYSYKYFYNDGYGKEYRIYNLKESFPRNSRSCI
jgi:hypothetical protein